jgi:GTPase
VAERRTPTVVFVGRPNVGKSTLFNRLTGTRRSIVAPVAGTTRDVITHPAIWEDRAVLLTDTGASSVPARTPCMFWSSSAASGPWPRPTSS